MPLERLTAPAAPPVALARARQYLRIDDATDDTLVSDIVSAAAHHVEQYASLALITTQWRLWADCVPGNGLIRLPLHPIASIDEVAIRSDSGWQILPADGWEADLASRPPRLRIAQGHPRPDGGLNAVRITFTAGFGTDDASVPEELQMAVLLSAAHLYEFREGNAAATALPEEARALLAPWRLIAL